jgi:hypothetical protein
LLGSPKEDQQQEQQQEQHQEQKQEQHQQPHSRRRRLAVGLTHVQPNMLTLRSKEILNILIGSPRPTWMRGNVYPLIQRLLLDSDNEGRCSDSIETLAFKCGVSESTVKRTLNKLVKAQILIVRSGKQYYTSNIYEVQGEALVSMLPAPKLRSSVGPIAEFLASHYYTLVKNVWRTPRNGHNKYRAKVKRGWEQHWGLVFQNWLDDGRTQEQIDLVVGWAFSNRPVLASRGPQCLKKYFARFLTEALGAKEQSLLRNSPEPVGEQSLRGT